MSWLKKLGWVGVAAFMAVGLGGCVTQWQRGGEADQYALKFQRTNTAPREGVTQIVPEAVRPGDILFSAERGQNSIGVRLFNNASISHAFIALENNMIAESIGTGVRIMPLAEAIASSNLVAVYRHPDIVAADAVKMSAFANSLNGSKYNYAGILKQAPYSILRKVCELPVNPTMIRSYCLSSMATLMVSPFKSDRYFCSQFVVEAFNFAGKPLTSVNPEWVNPSDLLHMREDDIPSIKPQVELTYVGHLACTPSVWNLSCSGQNEPEVAPTKMRLAR
ncbi:MAG: hypothetical protein KBC57_05595 [Neisseriaceae bacterium]|nr:hypothetical protein [Neisseriaceae bacterium]MBP6861813.1 hypothetical protein [Neisseriaceae bacterium]